MDGYLFFLGFLISFLGYIREILNDLFSPFLCIFIQCEGTCKGKAKVEDNDQIYLHPIVYNPNANISTSRGNFRVSCSDKIEYGRNLKPASEAHEFSSLLSFTRPIFDFKKGDDIIRFVLKSFRANITTPASLLIIPRISTSQAGLSALRSSNISTLRTMSPLFTIARLVSLLIPSYPQNIVESSELPNCIKRVKYIDTIPDKSSEDSKIENPKILITNTNKEFAIR